MPTLNWDSPTQVRWSTSVTTDQIGAVGDWEQSRSFPRLREALHFVMTDMKATPGMMIGVYPEHGSALIDLAEIEQAYRSGPHNEDEPDDLA